MSRIAIYLDGDENKITTDAGPKALVNSLVSYMRGLNGGVLLSGANLGVVTGASPAHARLTFTGQPTNNQTMAIAGVTFTAKTIATNGANEFTIGSTYPATAANLVSGVNASSSVNCSVNAALVLSGTVEFEAAAPGRAGNLIALATSLSNTTVSAANLSGGTEGLLTTANMGGSR